MKSAKNLTLGSKAKALRRNMTKEERHLWYDFLRTLSVMVHRQKVIGTYIVDFYIASANLVIELDGSQHYTPEGKEKDAYRTEILEGYDLHVIRFTNGDIKNNFFGESITVTGLLTGKDIYEQLTGVISCDELLISSSSLRYPEMDFLCGMTCEELSKKLKVKIRVCENDGFDFLDAVFGVCQQ